MNGEDEALSPLTKEAQQAQECSSCGALYITDYCCSEWILGDKIICDLDKTPDLSQRPPQNCPKCGNPIDGHYCQGCTLLRKKFKEDQFTYCIENRILQDSFKPSDDNTNVVNALQESFVVKQDPDGNSFSYDFTSNLFHDSPNIFNPPLQPPTYSYEFCGNDAYYGHDCSLQEELVVYINTSNWDRPTICYSDDDDVDYTIAVTPSLSTEEPDNSLSMGEHLDTVSATESDEFIKSSVESLVPIPSESEGIPDNMCDVPFHVNSLPLNVSKDQFEDFSDSSDESTSIDDDSFSIDIIEYVEASPLNSELVSSEVMEIVIPEVGGIDDDIILTIKDDILREKLLNINLFIANIEALKDNPAPSFNFMTKSSSTSLNSLLKETNTFDNSLLELETFFFDLEEISSGSTTTHFDISLPEYGAFYDDHVKEISSGSTTTHSDSSLYD
uniref:Pre-mRNA splicing Prp18-interacting factor n=1 Tax=Tanacetum cinerariifolium TaxID=118510 RepID=A0A699HA58_TANCI|nr:hypothetical protein [Tanacetum cinerariifolium]